MASVKNGFHPSLMALEGREQPGTMFSTGLDGAILAGAFGEEILKASRPALVNTRAAAENRQHGNRLGAGVAAVDRADEQHDQSGRSAVAGQCRRSYQCGREASHDAGRIRPGESGSWSNVRAISALRTARSRMC